MNMENLLKEITELLTKQKLTIATAESCTGGLLAHILTNISGSSAYYKQGVISYSNESKIQLLSVNPITLKQYGAVSTQTATEMANGIRKHAQVDIGISTTGIAGPTGGTKEKPVGLIYIGLAFSDRTITQQYQFSGNRLQNKTYTCKAVLKLLYEQLTRDR